MNNRRAVLFDLDGTLINTTNLILRCFDHSWQTVCGRTHTRAALIETFGRPLRDAMSSLAASSSDLEAVIASNVNDGDLIERLLCEYRSFNLANHDTLAMPFEGVCETIKELRARGYLTAVVTSKSRLLAVRGMRLCSIDGLMDAAVFLEDTDRHKPEPEPIFAALEKLNVRADAATYVGDSRHDIIAGRAAGVTTVAALWGPFPRAELEGARPNYMAETVTALLKIFE